MSAQIVVIGAGPAGIRAAECLVKAGIRPIVIDEGARAGGQIYRRPPDGFRRSARMLYGSEAAKARGLHTLFDAMVEHDQVSHIERASVIAIAGSEVHVLRGGEVERIGFQRLVIATGATDRVVPIPGWECGGVYTLGAAQIALKAQGVALGKSIVLLGSGPLLTLVATQLRTAGANVVAVLDTSSLNQQLGGIVDMASRPAVLLRGLAMRLRLGNVYAAGVAIDRIEASVDGPVAVHWRTGAGKAQVTSCDTVCVGWHLRSETHLADLAQVRFAYDDLWRQWLPVADAMGRAAPNIYLAGDSLRPLGADAAELTGRLAAYACLTDMGLQVAHHASDLRTLRRLQRFARGVAKAFPWPDQHVKALPPDTILCRCENVSISSAKAAAELGGAEVNRIKSLARVGMGRCQGRYCQLAEAELAAMWQGRPTSDVGRLRQQAPVRPTQVSAWLSGKP
ncbi:FAD/NAD(P)-binding oxidoreductase [Mesorhizobium sp.]|uniref:NAD(P)/FAD-dependent oxidoreductase n=1 Tax=Mesorhizobium sp. TaxID=1871066 RepID=UPI0025E4FFB1|nr:FAD/NAD(P)-binding oxidoreductase [Mesorhizobium sp.]